MKAWLIAARPKTLTAAVVPVFAGAALASLHGFQFDWKASFILFCCLASALCIQVGTNFINDVIDHDKGADTAERIGPQRITQSGLRTKKEVVRAAIFVLVLAFLFGVPLVIHGGWPIVAIGLVSIFMAYSYTGGPFPLAYLGLGDLFVILFFGLVAVGGVYFLLAGQYDMDAFVLGLQIGFLSTVLIAINNFRDMHQDRKADKKTLAVRFGPKFMRFEICFLLFTPFLIQFYWWPRATLWVVLAPCLLLPLAIGIAKRIVKEEPSVVFNQYLAQSAKLHSGFGLILSLVFYLTSR